MNELTTKEIKPLELPPLLDNPLVSVLVANYNYAKYLTKALDSMLGQTYPYFEVIICDDGSTDNSQEVIERYANQDPRIKFLFKKNGGVASALNAAYLHSTGQIICLLDADDYFAPKKLQKVVGEFVTHPESGMVLHPVMRVDTEGNYQGRLPLTKPIPRGWLAPYAVSIGGDIPWMPPAGGISIRRVLAERIFPIDQQFRCNIDVLIRLLAAMLSPVAVVDEVLTYYRLHRSNLSNLPAKLTIANHVEKRKKEIRISRGIYDYEASWLEKYFPNVQLLPFEQTWWYIEAQYMIAKLAKEPRATQWSWYRQLVSHPQTRNQVLYPLYLLSWWLPPETFNKFWDIASGHNKLKAILSIF